MDAHCLYGGERLRTSQPCQQSSEVRPIESSGVDSFFPFFFLFLGGSFGIHQLAVFGSGESQSKRFRRSFS